MGNDWPPNEQAVINEWANQYFPESMYCEEIPIQSPTGIDDLDIDLQEPDSQPKRADVVVLPSPSPQLRKEIQEYVGQTGTGVKYDSRQEEMEFDDTGLFEAILAKWPEDSIQVRVFEAKQELDYSAIGQIIVYSHHLPNKYQSFGTDIEVVEAGLIYHSTDNMIESAAQDAGIETYQVTPQ